MKIAFFSDIHGNLQALDAILADLPVCDEVICLGDILSLGPDSDKCLDRIIDAGITMVLGNHDLYCVNGPENDPSLTPRQRPHLLWVRSLMADRQMNFLKACPLEVRRAVGGKDVLFVHYPIAHAGEFYPFASPEELATPERRAVICSADLTFFGHEHSGYAWTDAGMLCIGSSGCRMDDTTYYYTIDDSCVPEKHELKYDRSALEAAFERVPMPERPMLALRNFGLKLPDQPSMPIRKA